MATEIRGFDVSRPAGEDLSGDQYHVVVLDGFGRVRRPNVITDIPFGILQNKPTTGQPASIRLIGGGGISKVVANAALAVNTVVAIEYVDAADAGKAQASVATQYPIGIVVEAADAEDDLCSVALGSMIPQAA